MKNSRRFLILLLAFCTAFPFLALTAAADCVVYRSVETGGRRIALTFDDGPHPSLTPKILGILSKYGVRATFFMIGENVTYYPEAARAVIAAGHEVGNHSFTHRNLSCLGEAGLEDEIGKCEDALEELCEYRPHLLRPPEGAISPVVREYSESGDYKLILWSLDTRDWESRDRDKIVESVRSSVQPGDIILMHDFIGKNSRTPEALEILLPELLADGFEFVTVSELLGGE